MNEIQAIVKTMSSREIAGLVDSRHADVCRTVERLIEKGVVGGCAPSAYTHEQNGQPKMVEQVLVTPKGLTKLAQVVGGAE